MSQNFLNKHCASFLYLTQLISTPNCNGSDSLYQPGTKNFL